MRSRWLMVVLLGWMAGCSSDDPLEPVPETSLEFLRFPPDLAPLVTSSGSFWAVAGENRELVLRYLPEPGDSEGDEFLRFKVSGNALLRRPDGTTFQRGDSVRITVTVDPEDRFLFRFEPSGLRFDPDDPAELRVRYLRVGTDLNGDGVSDARDRNFEARLRIWKQQRAGDPWEPVGTVRFEADKELRADIEDFTGFCIAA